MKNIDNQVEKVQRFILIQKTLGIKQKEFASKLGLTQSKVSLINNNKAGANILNEIFFRLNFEFGISKNWWETGVGEIFESKEYKTIKQPDDCNHTLNKEDESHLKNDLYWRGRYDQLKEEFERLREDIKENNN